MRCNADRRLLAAVGMIAAGTAFLVSGCDATAPASPTATPSTTTSTAPSTQDAAVEAATEAVQKYYAVADALLTDPAASIDRAAAVAGGDELDELRSRVQAQRVRGERETGSVVVTSATATGADLTSPVSVMLDLCLDVSAVTVVDATGASLLATDRPGDAAVTASVVDRGDRGWLVEQTSATGASCSTP